METIIMAGGEGKRLRPLTCDVPKPLLPILGKPVIEYILELLSLNGIDKATITTGYLGYKIEEYLSGKDFGISLKFSEEKTPLGTAGSVKKASEGEDEDILVISGDALCDFEISSALEFHRKHQAPVTIIAKSVDDPREYGLIDHKSDGRITGFLEKPDYGKVAGGLANTGIYIISRDILDLIEDGVISDFAKDIFPMLIERKMPMYLYEEKGYWCDIGSVRSYISCQEDILAGKVKCRLITEADSEGNIIRSSVPEGVKITPPVFIDEGVKIERSAVIERGSVILKGALISAGVKIKGAVLGRGAAIGPNSCCSGAVIDRGAFIKRSASVYERAVIGFGSVVGENAVVLPFVKVWPHKEIIAGDVVGENVQFQKTERELFSEDGITGETGLDITPEKLLKLGRSIGKLEGKIVVGCEDEAASFTSALALLSGIGFSKKGAVFLPGLPLSEFLFFAMRDNFSTAVFISSGRVCRVSLFGSDGLYLSHETERLIEENYYRGEHYFAPYDEIGRIETRKVSDEDYINDIISVCSDRLSGEGFSFVSSSERIRSIADRVVLRLGVPKGDMVFCISSDGRRVSGFSKKTGFISHHKLTAIAALAFFISGRDIALPFWSPRAIDKMAEFYGRRVLRFCDCSLGKNDDEAKRVGKDRAELRDGMKLIIFIYAFLSEMELDIASALGLIPEFEISESTVGLCDDGKKVLSDLKEFSGKPSAEGIYYDDELGSVYMKRTKNGRSVRLFCEAASTEFSKELSQKIENIVTGKTKLDIESKK